MRKVAVTRIQVTMLLVTGQQVITAAHPATATATVCHFRAVLQKHQRRL